MPFLVYRLLLLTLMLLSGASSVAQMQKLRVDNRHRFLVKEDGSPFVWIGDTHWFFAKLPPATIDSMLSYRSTQGFTMMFVSCRENLYNGEGPGSIDQPNEAWWSYLDAYVAQCAQRDLYVGIALGWWQKAVNNSVDELYRYGRWVGDRYKDHDNVVWLTLGETGSYSRKKTLAPENLRALVNGIRDGDTGNKLLTVHADYRRGTSLTDDATRCDFNNWQTSQWCCRADLPKDDDRNWTVWEAIAFDYDQRYDGQPKPTLDAEAWYENNKDFCGATPFVIRRRAYFTVFAGAFGHTYGAGGLWDGLTDPDSCSREALRALHYPGAESIEHLSNLLHRLGDDFLQLRPNQDLIYEGNSDDYDTHLQATVAVDSSFALVYSASDAPYTVDGRQLTGTSLSATWYNPRTGVFQPNTIPVTARNVYEVDPPGEVGAGNDWVWVVGRPSFTRSIRKK